MNKMKLGILICVLLIATAVPAVESLKNSTIKATVPSTSVRSMVASWIEKQKLLTSDKLLYGAVGWSVSLNGDTALIGAPYSGSAYVFTRTSTIWTEQTRLCSLSGTDNESDWASLKVSMPKTKASEKQLPDNKGNGIRIVVKIYPIISHPQLIAIVERNVLQNLDGNFTAKLTYKDNELFFDSVEGGFYSSFADGIYSTIRFSHPVLGRLYVDFTGSGKDYGLNESINLPVIILGTKPYTWGYTPW